MNQTHILPLRLLASETPAFRRTVRGAMTALAAAIFMQFAQSTSNAAPIHGLLTWDGNIAVQGLTGEVFLAIRGPESILLNSAALPSGSLTLDSTLPGEIAYLGLSGIQGSVNIGKVIKPGASPSELLQLKMAYQVGFTTPLYEVPLRLSFSPPGTDPNGADFVYGLPEPTTALLASTAVGALILRCRRHAGRSIE